MIRGRAASAVEVDTQGRESSMRLCGDQPALLVRGSSATNHCHAAPDRPTREYQRDDRRCFLTSAALPALAPLDKDFHISLPCLSPLLPAVSRTRATLPVSVADDWSVQADRMSGGPIRTHWLERPIAAVRRAWVCPVATAASCAAGHRPLLSTEVSQSSG